MRQIVWLMTLLLLMAPALPAPAAPTPAASPGPNSALKYDRGRLIISQDGKKVTLNVEIAKTVEARSQGLMNRKSLPDNTGMLFVFDEDAKWGFWMKNTLIPLSIGFIDNKWNLLEVKDMKVAPDPVNGPFEIYEPAAAYRYALEVNQGYFQRNGITAGARLELVVLK